MSIQWTFIAWCLYSEVGAAAALMLPLASPSRWTKFFRSNVFAFLTARIAWYFYAILALMALLLFDAVREMHKYSNSSEPGHTNVAAELKNQVKLFRAQRNFYITGFSIFMAFVVRRLMRMTVLEADFVEITSHTLQERDKVIKKSNEDAITAELIRQQEAEELRKLHDQLVEHQQERNTMQQTIVELNAELKAMNAQIDMWKSKYEELVAKKLKPQ